MCLIGCGGEEGEGGGGGVGGGGGGGWGRWGGGGEGGYEIKNCLWVCPMKSSETNESAAASCHRQLTWREPGIVHAWGLGSLPLPPAFGIGSSHSGLCWSHPSGPACVSCVGSVLCDNSHFTNLRIYSITLHSFGLY